jgi:NAD(P)-dependent dehydrogenase (short-subunit alcohol dehydrogenase family)
MGLNLGGKVVLITGAAMGIGRETALAFAKEGANLALLDIDEKELANTKAVVAKTGVKVSTVVADLSTDKRASQGVRNSLSAFGGDIDVLVNNVVSGAIRTFDELSDDDWSTTFNLNFMSYVRACRAVLPRMRMKGGAIINNASDLARQPEPLSIDYSVSKSAILALTKGLARAEAPKIRVNAVAPRPVSPPFWSKLSGFCETMGTFDKIPPRQAVEHEPSPRRLPVARLGKPEEEVASVIAFLASDQASFVTSSVWGVDGGSIRSII